MKATFFITYVMVDGWAGIAGEILRLKPLIMFHLKNFFLVKTEKDRDEAMNPGSIGFNTGEPQIQLYFLLGLVYAVVTPVFLPFILVFFALAYVVFRHQVYSCTCNCTQLILFSEITNTNKLIFLQPHKDRSIIIFHTDEKLEVIMINTLIFLFLLPRF